MKEVIIITGNVATGKTTLAKQLIQHLPAFVYVCLDASRLKFHDSLGDPDQEHELACREVVKGLVTENQVIFENAGCSQFFDTMLQLIDARGFQIRHIHLTADPAICIVRSKARKKYQFQVPPNQGTLSLEGFIHRCHRSKLTRIPDLIIMSGDLSADQVLDMAGDYLKSHRNGH